MPRFSERARSEILRAEAQYARGAANRGKEILEVTSALCLVHLAETFDRIAASLSALHSLLERQQPPPDQP
jgi:hypothetical protein